MYFNFRTWRDYISKDGTILFPKMARLRFQTWHDFTSEHVPDLKSRHLKNFLVVIIFENRQ